MLILSLLLALMVQAPAPNEAVLVGLTNGQQVIVQNPEFTGFIQGRNSETLLIYRQDKVHGEMPIRIISRIDFVEYRRGQPFAMIVTLKNGQKLGVQSERQNFVTVHGNTDVGPIRISHPDPAASVLRVSPKKANRAKDLTIQYLEFPAS